MNLILLHDDDFGGAPNKVCLKGRRAEHVSKILQASTGDELCVGRINEKIGTGRILSITSKKVEMDILLKQKPPEALDVVLVLALPRPVVFKRILSAVASLGVKRIYLIGSRRVEKSYWKSPALGTDQIEQQLILGLEQGRDTVMPRVEMRQRFKPFVEDELPGLVEGKKGFVFHPEARKECPARIVGPVVVAVGPEGGFIPYELEKFGKAGLDTVELSTRILRVETVIPYIFGRLSR